MNEWFDAEQRAERAQQLSESRRWAEALAEIDAALDVNPTNGTWLAQRGFILDQLDRPTEAIEAYAEALKIEADDRDLLLALGIDLGRVGRLSESLKTFTRLTELYPDFEPGFCYQIMIHAELGQHEKAEEAFYLAQQLKDDCPQCFHHMAHSLADRGDYKRAIHCWQRVLAIEPLFEEVKGQMAQAYRAMGDHEQAKQWYLSAIREDPGDVDLLYEMGDLLADMGDLEGAGTKFRQVVELVPDHGDGLFALAQVTLASGQADKALDLFESVRQLDEGYVGLSLHVGSAYLKLGRHAEALPHLEAAVREAPSGKDELMLLGNCLLWLRRPEAASDLFRRVIALDAEVPSAHHNLGVCRFLTGDYASGIDHCRQAIKLKPDYMLAIVKTTLAYQKLGRFREARSMMDYGLGVDSEHALLRQLRERFWRARVRFVIGRVGSFVGRIFGRWPGLPSTRG